MLLRQLKYFLAVVETDSFTEAAAQCFISQSAISQQIQALERELGVKLLNRENRKFTLTEAGKFFYQNGRLLADEAEQLCRETKKIGGENSLCLRIGYLKCYSGLEFQMAIAEFSRQHPEVSIEILDGNHEDLYDALRANNVDVVLNDQRRAFSDAYINHILTATECYIELSGYSTLAQRDFLTAEDLKSLPCILIASSEQRENEQTYSVPKFQLAFGCFDILSHIMETYFSACDAENVSDDISEALMRGVIRDLRASLADPEDYNARSNLMWESTMCENRIIKLGKRGDFQCHQMEHQLGAYTDCNHGAGLAVLHPVYYRHIYRDGLSKFKRFAVRVWGIDPTGRSDEEVVAAGVEALADFIREIGLPTTLRELGVDESVDLGAVAASCNKAPGSYKKMTHAEIAQILQEAL